MDDRRPLPWRGHLCKWHTLKLRRFRLPTMAPISWEEAPGGPIRTRDLLRPGTIARWSPAWTVLALAVLCMTSTLAASQVPVPDHAGLDVQLSWAEPALVVALVMVLTGAILWLWNTEDREIRETSLGPAQPEAPPQRTEEALAGSGGNLPRPHDSSGETTRPGSTGSHPEPASSTSDSAPGHPEAGDASPGTVAGENDTEWTPPTEGRLVGKGTIASFRYAIGRDVGVVRETQEDAFSLLSEKRTGGFGLVVCIADGMGGEAAGEVASYLTCHAIEENYGSLRSQGMTALDALQRAMELANDEILRYSRTEGREGMGSTVVALAIDTTGAWVAHVGDSRAYVKRGQEFLRVTRDHSRVQRMLDQGLLTAEEAEVHPEGNVLSQALGRTQVAVDRNGDRSWPASNCTWLVCSDGLTAMTSEAELALALETLEPIDVVQSLLDVCRERGGHDNVTIAVLSDVSPEGRERIEPLRGKLPIRQTDESNVDV